MWNKREKTVLRIAAVGCIAIIAGLVIGIKSAKGEESLLPDRVVERECMAEAILFEAGNQPIVGKLAVAEVILNRVRSDKYPNTICGVVHEGPIYKWFKVNLDKEIPVKHKCQFSYYCDGKSDSIEPYLRTKTWQDVLKVVIYIMHRSEPYITNLLQGATHYHADYVNPSWAKTLTRIVKIENHIFYK